ncbi:hypothetical protein FB451DRAFT_1171730 [Mycena latifolia]|nr:hypothetical protein FB451DRAFT_1171730 [Mycena latifolia]
MQNLSELNDKLIAYPHYQDKVSQSFQYCTYRNDGTVLLFGQTVRIQARNQLLDGTELSTVFLKTPGRTPIDSAASNIREGQCLYLTRVGAASNIQECRCLYLTGVGCIGNNVQFSFQPIWFSHPNTAPRELLFRYLTGVGQLGIEPSKQLFNAQFGGIINFAQNKQKSEGPVMGPFIPVAQEYLTSITLGVAKCRTNKVGEPHTLGFCGPEIFVNYPFGYKNNKFGPKANCMRWNWIIKRHRHYLDFNTAAIFNSIATNFISKVKCGQDEHSTRKQQLHHLQIHVAPRQMKRLEPLAVQLRRDIRASGKQERGDFPVPGVDSDMQRCSVIITSIQLDGMRRR